MNVAVLSWKLSEYGINEGKCDNLLSSAMDQLSELYEALTESMCHSTCNISLSFNYKKLICVSIQTVKINSLIT